MTQSEKIHAADVLSGELAATRRVTARFDAALERIKARVAAALAPRRAGKVAAPNIYEDLYYPDGNALRS